MDLWIVHYVETEGGNEYVVFFPEEPQGDIVDGWIRKGFHVRSQSRWSCLGDAPLDLPFESDLVVS